MNKFRKKLLAILLLLNFIGIAMATAIAAFAKNPPIRIDLTANNHTYFISHNIFQQIKKSSTKTGKIKKTSMSGSGLQSEFSWMECSSSGFCCTILFYISAFISIIYGYMEKKSSQPERSGPNHYTMEMDRGSRSRRQG